MAVDDVGEAPFEASEGFLGGLALETLALVVGASGAGGKAKLGDGHDVEGVVDPTIPRPGEPMTGLLAEEASMGAVPL